MLHCLAWSCACPMGLPRLEVELEDDELDANGVPLPEVLERFVATLGCTDVKDAFHRSAMPAEMMCE